jgi:Pyruvate/2-oxoacid:ferredoxin oxidoreductase delta subunit
MAGFRFSFDADQCLNCGVCADVCPPRCLDMTRPRSTGPEPVAQATSVPSEGQSWMTVFPIQVGRCTGCMVCVMECPTDIIHVEKVEGEVTFAPSQGPLIREHAYDPEHWQALSDYTRVSRKNRPLGDPWGTALKWLPVRRNGTWQVWRTWRTHEDYTQAQTPANAETTRAKE